MTPPNRKISPNEDTAGGSINSPSSSWKSIPDPPTPTITLSTIEIGDINKNKNRRLSKSRAVASRRRKRDSFSVLRDVTNRQCQVSSSPDKTYGETEKDSLCADSCLAVTDGTCATAAVEKTSNITNRKSNINQKDHDSNLSSNENNNAKYLSHPYCEEFSTDFENNDKVTKRRNRKKRRSLLLPTEVDSDEDDWSLCGDALKLDKANSSPEKTNLSDELAGPSIGNVSNEFLAQIVRDYCTLPVEERPNSKEAETILRTVGYPIWHEVSQNSNEANDLGERIGTKSTSNIQSNASAKRDFLLKVEPVVRAMEARNKSDAHAVKNATNCEAKKNSLGHYCYYDLDDGKQIDPSVYKHRYTSMVECDRRERKKNQSQSFNKTIVRGEIIESTTNEKCPTDEQSTHSNLDGVAVGTGKNDRDSRIEKSTGGDESCMEVKDDDSNMDIDDSISLDESLVNEDEKDLLQPSLVISPLENIAANAGDNNEFVDCKEGLLQVKGTKHSQESQNDASSFSRPLGSQSILAGMPPSNDPRVIEARRKLWRSIDSALATYSQEILALEKCTPLPQH